MAACPHGAWNQSAFGGLSTRSLRPALAPAPARDQAIERLQLVRSLQTRRDAAVSDGPDRQRHSRRREIRISAFRMPPVPIAACGFDDHGVSCVWPFKKIASVSGRLLSVDYTRGQPGAANRSLIRRPR
jgi:hypothetical protein